jgi:predicted DNA-binding transcriptional regulator AlpA
VSRQRTNVLAGDTTTRGVRPNEESLSDQEDNCLPGVRPQGPGHEGGHSRPPRLSRPRLPQLRDVKSRWALTVTVEANTAQEARDIIVDALWDVFGDHQFEVGRAKRDRQETAMADSDLLTVEDVAAMIHSSPGTIHYWRSVSPEKAPPAIKVGRRLLFRRADLETWLASKSVGR